MKSATLRRLLHCIFMVFLTLSFEGVATQAQSSPQVRMKWQTFISGPGGAARLASLKKAVLKMKSLDNALPASVDFRRSWKYWANIHGYYGPQSMDGTVALHIADLNNSGLGSYVSYYNNIADQTPPDQIAQAVWATCKHSSDSGAGQANFFGWHRMYLYYFERVLRWAAQDNTLRLPYWDYTNSAQEAIPAEFRNTSSTMYDPRRDPGMNGSSTLSATSTNIDAALRNPNYLSFEYGVETGIHGYVHCAVGPTCPVADMGDVPVAGNDPIFYSHHANIDRIFACWQNLHPTPTGQPWEAQTFSFPDETGNLQTRPVSDFLDSTSLGYVYENVASCSRKVTRQPVRHAELAFQIMSTEERFPNVVGASKPLPINGPHITVDIAVPVAKMQALVKPVGATPSSILVLRDVKAYSPPGTLLNVYVSKQGNPGERQFVGTINWFNAFHHRDQPSVRTLEFDLSDQLRALNVSPTTAGVTITFEATDGRVPIGSPGAAAAPQAIRPEVLRAFRPEANVQVGTIELRQAN
ncbi:tyrosinase family protein [Granulicella aggregans]|uniref:tyrosinase family protein n=1 Tax=Granulicella aggregans TaxID=474949 RepID=UPI0021DF591C|nr:tyrosinase family protein [Granulicella aggregans]